MASLAQLPSRPLRKADVAALDEDDRLRVVPYGGVPEGDDIRIYAVKLATSDTAHALGFDESKGRWQQLATVDADDLAVADERLDGALDEWVQERYGGQFEVLKTV